MSKTIRVACACLFLCLATAPPPASAQSSSSDWFGGSGGKYTTRHCEPLNIQFMTGLDARWGAWVDRLWIHCGFQGGRDRILDPVGGDGGEEGGFRRCRDDGVVTGITVRSGHYLDGASLHCTGLRALQRGESDEYVLPWFGGTGGDLQPAFRCPVGTAVHLLEFRADVYVDAIRLHCAPVLSVPLP
jgi:hypothetical protein